METNFSSLASAMMAARHQMRNVYKVVIVSNGNNIESHHFMVTNEYIQGKKNVGKKLYYYEPVLER